MRHCILENKTTKRKSAKTLLPYIRLVIIIITIIASGPVLMRLSLPTDAADDGARCPTGEPRRRGSAVSQAAHNYSQVGERGVHTIQYTVYGLRSPLNHRPAHTESRPRTAGRARTKRAMAERVDRQTAHRAVAARQRQRQEPLTPNYC